LLRDGFGALLEAFTVFLDELLEHADAVTDMDSSASVEFRWLQQPKVVAFKVAKGHGVSKYMLLEDANVLVLGFLFLFHVLLNKASFVVVEVLEDELLIVGVLLDNIGVHIGFFQHVLLSELFDLDEVLHGLLLVVV